MVNGCIFKIKTLFEHNLIDIGVNLRQTLVKAFTVFNHYNIWALSQILYVNYVHGLIVVNKFKNIINYL